MLLPEKMTKVLIVGSKEKLKETIDLFYELETIHPIDFHPDEPGFSLGAPFPIASEASQKLLKLRAVEKNLDLEKPAVKTTLSVSEVEDDLEDRLREIDTEIAGATETKAAVLTRVHELGLKKKQLEPLLTIPLELDLYHGYQSIEVLTGFVRDDPESALRAGVDRIEVYKSSDDKFVAVFVANSEAAEAQRILAQHGFTEMAVPEGTGEPAEVVRHIDAELEAEAKALSDATEKLEKLKEQHEAYIMATDEHLSIQVEKAELPLRTGATDHTFVIDAWIPSQLVAEAEKKLRDRCGEDVFLEVIEVKGRKEEHTAGERAPIHPEEEEAPVKMESKKPVGYFSHLTELISIPRYNEIDPTTVISITFPLFFGLMVGDVGYGIPFIVLGWLGLKKAKSADWRTISTMLFFGGIWATIFGLFFFGEMYGMHFTHNLAAGEPNWADLLGISIPSTINLGPLSIPLGLYNKLENVKILLYITVWIGLIHLFLGYGLGFANIAMKHGLKHAVMEKLSWILILVAGALLLLVIVDGLILGKGISFGDPRLLIGIGLIVVGAILAIRAEGGTAILELPALMSNVISYTRLAAIGMSKAGLALAFNNIAIVLMAPAGGVMIIVAAVIFAIGHLMIFVLAVLSAGIHGIRLHYVELFTKFYTGGGLKFNPLRVVRKYTTER
jgi:V/A-type H+-transporting ATPase subunit I